MTWEDIQRQMDLAKKAYDKFPEWKKKFYEDQRESQNITEVGRE